MTKTKEITTQLSDEQLNELKSLAPTNDTYQKIQFPRLGMLAKDITEETGTGKNKKIEVLNVAGEFFIEVRTEELNEKGKNIYKKNFFEGETLEGIIVFSRKKLSFWDDDKKMFINTPLFDDANEVIPLWEGGKEIARKTPALLQKMYPSVTAKGKPSSKLKEITVLYVDIGGVIHEFDLSTSSKWEFSDYKKRVVPSSVVTVFSSLEETHGSNTYKKTTFTVKRMITAEEFETVKDNVLAIKYAIQSEKDYYASLNTDVPVTPEEDWSPDLPKVAVALPDGHEM